MDIDLLGIFKWFLGDFLDFLEFSVLIVHYKNLLDFLFKIPIDNK